MKLSRNIALLAALLMTLAFATSCASTGYCKSWNDPQGAENCSTLHDKG